MNLLALTAANANIALRWKYCVVNSMLFTYSLLVGKCVLKQSALRINFEVHTGVAPLGDFINILIEV